MTTRLEELDFEQWLFQHIELPTLALALDFIMDHLNPEQVFNETQLEAWADNNGYIKETVDNG